MPTRPGDRGFAFGAFRKVPSDLLLVIGSSQSIFCRSFFYLFIFFGRLSNVVSKQFDLIIQFLVRLGG